MRLNALSESEIIRAISYLDYDDREEWIMVGMCLKHELGERGYEIWLNYCDSIKEAKTVWKSFKGNQRTIGTLIHEAMKRGFKFNEEKGYVSEKVIQQRKLEREARQQQEEITEQQLHEKQACKAKQMWRTFSECIEHPYLTSKDILPHGGRVGAWTYKNYHGELVCDPNALVYPLSYHGELVSLQAILPNGEKKYLWGAKKSGVSFVVGERTDKVLLCEGIATGITLHEATQYQVWCALDAGNLVNVAKEIRKAYPLCNIVVCADNDQYKRKNTGLNTAYKVACEVDADVVYPTFRDTKDKPTDFNDFYNGDYDEILSIVERTSRYQRAINNNAPYVDISKCYFVSEPTKKFEESSDYNVVAMAGLQTALMLSEQVPSFCTMDMIRQHLTHPRLNHKTHLEIMKRVQWAVLNRRNEAMTSIRPLKWNKIHSHTVVNELNHELIKEGMNIVFAPMGTGKTKNIIAPIASHSETFVAIAHRKSLIDELSNTLGIENYEVANCFHDKIAVCLPSAMSYRFRPFMKRVANVAIDEISQNIRFTKSKACRATGADQEQVYLGAKEILRECVTAVVADASIDQVTMDFCEQARPDESFNIIEVAPTQQDKTCFLYDEENLLSAMQTELLNGGKVWCAVESVDKAEALAVLFQNYKIMLVTSRNNQKKFLQNIKEESKKYDMVIASPVISSGVSVEHDEPHFTMIAGIAGGSAICFSDFAQMLGRVRYVKEYHVCLKKNNLKNEGITANTILLGQRQASQLEGVVTHENDYSKAMATIEANERIYRSDFANGFIWFLQYYCFNIEPKQAIGVDYAIVDKLKEITKENKHAYRQKICNAKSITKEEMEALEKKREQTSEEQVQVLSYKAKLMLGYEQEHVLTIEDVEMFEQLPKIDRFARLLGLTSKTDDTERNIALRKFEKAQIKGVDILFDGMPIEETFFTNDVCKSVIDRVCKNENRFLLSALKLVPYQYARDIQDKQGNMKEIKPPKNCAKAMASVLDKYGLSWKSRTKGYSRSATSERGYMVTPESFCKMKKYAQQRYCML